MEAIERCVRARVPLVQLVTYEEQRAMGFIREVTKRLNDAEAIGTEVAVTQKLFCWSMIRGLYEDKPKLADALKTAVAADPLEVLGLIKESKESGIFVLFDFHPFMKEDNPSVIRAVRELGFALKAVKKTVVFLQSIKSIPVELEKDIALIDMALPDVPELQARLAGHVKRLGESKKYKADLDEDAVEQIVQAGQGLTQTEFDTALSLALVEHGGLTRKATVLVGKEKQAIIKKTGILEFFEADAGMDGVGGINNLKDWCKKRKRAFTNDARDFGLPQPKGLLILGPPGTGKSLTAKAVSRLWELPLLRLDMGAVFGSLVGESESKMRGALRMAEAVAPCIVWIDEIEKAMSGMQSSGSSDGGTTARVFGTMLTWMNEKKAPVFVIATANDVSQLPPELMRKGRFDEIFFVDLPSEEEREDILKIHLKKRNREVEQYDLRIVAKMTEGFSGAELEQVVVAAMYDAFDTNRDISNADLQRAAATTVPLSTTMSEMVEGLRKWCSGRAVHASLAPKQTKDEMVAAAVQQLDLPALDE